MRFWFTGLAVVLASASALVEEPGLTAAQAVAAREQDDIQLMVHSLGEGYGWANAALILSRRSPLFCAPPERVITYDQHLDLLAAFVTRSTARDQWDGFSCEPWSTPSRAKSNTGARRPGLTAGPVSDWYRTYAAAARWLVSRIGAGYLILMPRPAKHDEARILSAAASLVAARGPGAATITAISTAVGAPNGSIYHRFKSRDELLGRLWLTKAAFFQDQWVKALEHPEPRQAGLDAALSLPRAVREDFDGARIMLLHRSEDFLSEGWPPEMKTEAERLRNQVKEQLAGITRRLFGRSTAAAREVATFAVLDLPFSAVRRHVGGGDPPPPQIDRLIAKAYAAVIDGTDPPGP